MKRNLILAVVAIVGAIFYLQGISPKHAAPLSGSDNVATSTVRTPDYATLAAQYSMAHELVHPDGYINTGGQPITISSMVGNKVVLIDFWTYSCINCQRTIPYLNAWYQKYKDFGLQIIGVHSPEFNFEKVLSNVQAAVTKFGIQYPVVLDSELATWDAYSNMYWPEHYLMDINGLIVDRQIGEGGYADTETEIQKLLQQRSDALGLNLKIPTGTVDITQAINANSPETYFGSNRNEYLSNGTQGTSGVQTLSITDNGNVQLNTLYMGGTWDFEGEYAQNQSKDATIVYNYDAQHVYFVAAASSTVLITVLRDGKPLTTDRGADVDANGNATIQQARLYDLIDQSSMQGHTLEIIVHNPGLQAFTFTFG